MKWYLALVPMLVACSTAENVFYVDSKFTAEERSAIKKAADDWSYATNGLANIDFVWDAEVDESEIENPKFRKTIIRSIDAKYWPVLPEGRGVGSTSFFPHGVESIAVWMNYFDGDLKFITFTLTHEFGHHFVDTSHVNDPYAVMNAPHSEKSFNRN